MCDLYALSKDDFQHVLDEFPNMRIKLEDVASERLATITSSRDLEEANMTPLVIKEEMDDGTAALRRTDSQPFNVLLSRETSSTMTSSLSDQSHSPLTKQHPILTDPSATMTISDQPLLSESPISTAPIIRSRTSSIDSV